MHLLDDGRIVDADFSLDFLNAEPCLIVESSGGANKSGRPRRNPEYNRLVSLLLERLAGLKVRITRVVLDSAKVSAAPLEDRLVSLDSPYPVDPSQVDTEELRKSIGRGLASMFREPDTSRSGNAQKRFRICLERAVSIEELDRVSGDGSGLASDITLVPGLTETERVYLRAARIGQGDFRDGLVRRFRGRCPVTLLENLELLVASHIKPWSACSNPERLDPENGILLSALVDKLFDRGLLSFGDNGDPIFSPMLSKEDLERLRVHCVSSVRLTEANRRYLEYHRRARFKVPNQTRVPHETATAT